MIVRPSFGRELRVRGRTSLVTILSGLFVLSVVGCIQDSPSVSVDRTVATLVELLQDERIEIKRTAAESLGKIGDPKAITPLMSLTDDPSPSIRAAAVKSLGRLVGDSREEVVGHLLRALGDNSDLVRRAATEALAEVEPAASRLSGLPALLVSGDLQVRRAASRALWVVDVSELTDTIRLAARDPDSVTRQSAVAAIGEVGGSAARSLLMERAIHDPAPAVRTQAVYYLRQVADTDEIREVLRRVGTQDQDEGVRRWATARRGSD